MPLHSLSPWGRWSLRLRQCAPLYSTSLHRQPDTRVICPNRGAIEHVTGGGERWREVRPEPPSEAAFADQGTWSFSHKPPYIRRRLAASAWLGGGKWRTFGPVCGPVTAPGRTASHPGRPGCRTHRVCDVRDPHQVGAAARETSDGHRTPRSWADNEPHESKPGETGSPQASELMPASGTPAEQKEKVNPKDRGLRGSASAAASSTDGGPHRKHREPPRKHGEPPRKHGEPRRSMVGLAESTAEPTGRREGRSGRPARPRRWPS